VTERKKIRNVLGRFKAHCSSVKLFTPRLSD
jgi:hypothetical protein